MAEIVESSGENALSTVEILELSNIDLKLQLLQSKFDTAISKLHEVHSEVVSRIESRIGSKLEDMQIDLDTGICTKNKKE